VNFEVRWEMVTSLDDVELRALHQKDLKQGKFWFRLHINDFYNIDDMYLYLLEVGLMDFQARQACIDFGEYANNNGETIAEAFGIKECEVMSFILIASSEKELEEKAKFFVEGVKQVKDKVTHILLHRFPEWVTIGSNLKV